MIIPFYRFNEVQFDAFHIIWTLIGLPAEIGYYSKNLRELKIINDKTIHFRTTSQEDIEIEILDNHNSLNNEMMMMTFEYPPTNNEPDLEIKQFSGKFVQVKNHNKENNEDMECNLHYCAIQFNNKYFKPDIIIKTGWANQKSINNEITNNLNWKWLECPQPQPININEPDGKCYIINLLLHLLLK